MIVLYQGGGASGFELTQSALPAAACRSLLSNVGRVLRSRDQSLAAQELQQTPFSLVDGTNAFGDDFTVLWAVVPLATYERLRRAAEDGASRPVFRAIANTITELGAYVRFIAVDLEFEPTVELSDTERTRSLTEVEIRALVYMYIGVTNGYLGDFTYQTHLEFYVDLDLPIDPNDYPGTTRARFERILSEQSPIVQATILQGVLARFPVGTSTLRTAERAAKIGAWIRRLRGTGGVLSPAPRITSAIVERALADAEHLIAASGPSSGVDRIHTAFHGYLRAVCDDRGIVYPEDASISSLLGRVRDEHPAFSETTPRADDIRRVLRSMAAIADALNPLRNQASVAHPNAAVLEAAEAMLVVNTVRTLLHYVDARVSG